MRRNKGRLSGFTLIELLVVISIIGFLATVATVMLNSARIRSRDILRIATLKQIYKQIVILGNGDAADMTGCVRVPGPGGLGNIYELETCTGIATEHVSFTKFIDPYQQATDYCSSEPGITKPCKYSIGMPQGAAMSTNNFMVCTYLEGSVDSWSGLIKIDQTGMITNGCPLSFS